MMWLNLYSIGLYVFFLFAIIVTINGVMGSVPKPSAEERIQLSTEQHYNDAAGGEHNAAFDHDAFLGGDVAKTFDKLPVEESKTRLSGIFDLIDTDTDGFVSNSELIVWVTQTKKRNNMAETKKEVTRHDLNKDKHVTWEEYKSVTYPEPEEGEQVNEYAAESQKHDSVRFVQADVNNDEKLSVGEYAAFLHPEDSESMVDHMVRSAMDDMDTDRDNKISMQEYSDHMWAPVPGQKEPDWLKSERKQFSDFHDKNADGHLDWSEVKEWILPYDYVASEAEHLLAESDRDGDEKLSKEEMLDNHGLFVGSQVDTEFIDPISNIHEEL